MKRAAIRLYDAMPEPWERFRNWLFQRRRAYQQTFDPDRPATKLVLADLAAFCSAHETTMHVDPRAQAALEGRRDVWLRISYHLQLTDEQFWDLYGRTDDNA